MAFTFDASKTTHALAAGIIAVVVAAGTFLSSQVGLALIKQYPELSTVAVVITTLATALGALYHNPSKQ